MIFGRFRLLGPAFVTVSVVLTACGSSGGSTAETTLPGGTTLWRTLPPVANSSDAADLELEGGVLSYKVKSGDFPNSIAKRAGGGCSGTELLEMNPEISLEEFVPGIIMKIPAACVAAGVTEESLNAGDDASTDAETDGGSTDDSSDDETDTTDAPKYNSYTVVSGDYPFKIVEKTGCSYDELKKANGTKFTKPKPKSKLKIPVDCDTREAEDSDSDSSD